MTHHLLGPHLAQLCTRALLPAGPHARVAGEELSISDPSPSPKRPPQQDDKDASSAMSAGATEPGLVQRHLALGDVHLCRRAQLCGPRPSLPLACRRRSPSPKRPPQQNGEDAGGGWGHGERPQNARASEGRGPQSCARRRRCMSPSARWCCTKPFRCRRTWRCSRPTSRRAQPRRASLVAAPHAACHAACYRRPVVGLCGCAAPALPAPVTRCMALAMPVRGRMLAGHVKTARMLAPREPERARPIACAPLQTCWSCAGATLDRASPHAVDQCHAGIF